MADIDADNASDAGDAGDVVPVRPNTWKNSVFEGFGPGHMSKTWKPT